MRDIMLSFLGLDAHINNEAYEADHPVGRMSLLSRHDSSKNLSRTGTAQLLETQRQSTINMLNYIRDSVHNQSQHLPTDSDTESMGIQSLRRNVTASNRYKVHPAPHNDDN